MRTFQPLGSDNNYQKLIQKGKQLSFLKYN